MRIVLVAVGSIGLALTMTPLGSGQSLRSAPSVEWFGQGSGIPRMPHATARPSTPTGAPSTPDVDYDTFGTSRDQTLNRQALYTAPYDVREMPPAYDEVNVASWQLLPDGLVYKSYLAGTQEPRLAMHMIDINSEGIHLDGFLGSRVPLLRYGTNDPIRPEGFQIDVEGTAHVRIDLKDRQIVDAADFRAGLPISFGYGRHRTKLGYYHLSSHLQDEFLFDNPGFVRLNFSRDVLILAHSFYLTDQLKIYAEVGYAVLSEISLPWEFQFGLDYAPCGPTGIQGAPFFAFNGHLREEVNFGGALTAQLGWAWVGDTGKMLRTGVHYYNGESNEYSFFDRFEHQIGFGLWYDL
jgi:hypothetical protein